MEKFFKELSSEIVSAVKTDMKRILDEVGHEKIYSVALVTDSDCITLYLALNTNEYLVGADEKYLNMVREYLSEEQIKAVEEGSLVLTKWFPDEWGYSDGSNSELNNVSKKLYKQEEINSEVYANSQNLFFEAVIDAFQKLIEENVFGENNDEITFFISVSDDEKTIDIENYSAQRLNSERVYQVFAARESV